MQLCINSCRKFFVVKKIVALLKTMVLKYLKTIRINNICNILNARHVSYIQGQEPEQKIREYFYYINHEGMLFLDDAKLKNFTSCFKEKKFLKFFFSRLKMNDSKRYTHEFPYLSLCGRERNFVRCDDAPVVFTHIVHDASGGDKLSYGHAGDLLTFEFKPSKIYMNPKTGRVYHPAMERAGSIGLVRSKLAIDLSRRFEFNEGEDRPPTHFNWKGERFQLENKWVVGTQRYGMQALEEQTN